MPARVDEQPTVTVETFPPRQGYPTTDVPLRDGMTLQDLLQTLHVPGNTETVLVNDAYSRPDYPLQPGDRVRIIAFMWGG